MSKPNRSPVKVKQYEVKQSKYEHVSKLPTRSVINLPQSNGLKSMASKVLIHRQQIRLSFPPAINVIRLFARHCWIKAAHNRKSRRAAYRLLAIGAIETRS